MGVLNCLLLESVPEIASPLSVCMSFKHTMRQY